MKRTGGIYGDINPNGIMFYNKIIDNLLLRGEVTMSMSTWFSIMLLCLDHSHIYNSLNLVENRELICVYQFTVHLRTGAEISG